MLGPTRSLYWSTTSVDQLPGQAFVINFFFGDSTAGFSQKNFPAASARAVRGGR